MPGIRRTIVTVIAIALLSSACSAESEDTTTTVESLDPGSTTSTPATAGGTPVSTIPENADTEEEICRTLSLLYSAGVTPPFAAAAITETDLLGATSEVKATYGDLLVSAPQDTCPEMMFYGSEISYWLGF